MSKFNSFEEDLLRAIFLGTSIPGLTDNAAAPADLEIALHSADPGEAGDQAASEVAYTGYARVTVARNGTGWTVTGSQVANAGSISFPQCTAGSATATHWSAGIVGSNAGRYYGALAAPLDISNGITPEFAAGTLTISED